MKIKHNVSTTETNRIMFFPGIFKNRFLEKTLKVTILFKKPNTTIIIGKTIAKK